MFVLLGTHTHARVLAHTQAHILAHSPELNGWRGVAGFWWKALLSSLVPVTVAPPDLLGDSPCKLPLLLTAHSQTLSAPSFKNRAPVPEKCFPGCFLCSPASLPNPCSNTTSLGTLAPHANILWVAVVGGHYSVLKCPVTHLFFLAHCFLGA